MRRFAVLRAMQLKLYALGLQTCSCGNRRQSIFPLSHSRSGCLFSCSTCIYNVPIKGYSSSIRIIESPCWCGVDVNNLSRLRLSSPKSLLTRVADAVRQNASWKMRYFAMAVDETMHTEAADARQRSRRALKTARDARAWRTYNSVADDAPTGK